MLQGQFARLGRLFPVFIVLIVWEFLWKIIALRKTGRNNQLLRFICILIFNTVGILPILYLSFFQKKHHGGY
ncbi:MAG: DUF5652 family protein [Candidatus Peribacteria bacterium]|nr:DUF5652 family protein [Candidatus Peribacteria bacterium]